MPNTAKLRTDLLNDPPATLNATPDVFANHTDVQIRDATWNDMVAGTGDINDAINYVMFNEHNSGTSGDDTAVAILVRMRHFVAVHEYGTRWPGSNPNNPLTTGTSGAENKVTYSEWIKIRALLEILDLFAAASGNVGVDFTNANWDQWWSAAANASIISTAQRDALQGFGLTQSWANSKGFGKLSTGDITAARNAA